MISPLPPLNAVRAFVAAARHQSFTLAAGELNVTHSAVSRQVQALEAYMGVQLFERRVRQISLTVEGLRFFAQADAALRQIAAATQSVMGQAPGRVVRINVRPTFAVRWLIPRLPHFVERHPGVEPLVLTSTVPPERATDPFDLAIRRGMVGWPPAALLRPFLEDEVCVVASPASLAAHPVRTPTDLSGLALLWSRTRKGDWDAWVEHTGHERIKPAGQMQFEHVHFVVQAAIDGLGFAAVPASLVATGLASGQLQCPFPELRMPVTRYYFTVAADAVPEAQLFAQWLESEARSG